MILRRLSLLLLFSVVSILGTNQCGPVGWYFQDALTQPAANNGYSGYTMYERCHLDSAGVMHAEYTHRGDC